MKDLLERLASVANACDKKGLTKEADQLDNIIVRLAQSLRPVGKPFVENGIEMQMYIDNNGKSVKKPTNPTDESPGLLERGYNWLTEKGQEAVNTGLKGGVKGLGKIINEEEGGEQFAEWAFGDKS